MVLMTMTEDPTELPFLYFQYYEFLVIRWVFAFIHPLPSLSSKF